MRRRRKRLVYRKKRRYRRKTRILRAISNRIHNFKETVELANLQTSTTSQNTFFGISFSLSTIGNISAISSLFDSYRIMGVKLSFYPQYNVSYTQGTTVAGEIPMIYTCIDYDSDTAPTSIGEIDQYRTCKRQFFQRPHSRFLKPRALAYSAVTTSSSTYGNTTISRKTWMDMANTTVKYFGVLGAIVFTNSSALPPATQVRVTATIYYQCQGQR